MLQLLREDRQLDRPLAGAPGAITELTSAHARSMTAGSEAAALSAGYTHLARAGGAEWAAECARCQQATRRRRRPRKRQ